MRPYIGVPQAGMIRDTGAIDFNMIFTVTCMSEVQSCLYLNNISMNIFGKYPSKFTGRFKVAGNKKKNDPGGRCLCPGAYDRGA